MAERATIEWAVAHPTRPARSAGLLVRTPYDETFIDELKTLPQFDREWDPALDAWWVASRHEGQVRRLICKHFGGGMVIGTDGQGDEVFDRGGRSRQGRLL